MVDGTTEEAALAVRGHAGVAGGDGVRVAAARNYGELGDVGLLLLLSFEGLEVLFLLLVHAHDVFEGDVLLTLHILSDEVRQVVQLVEQNVREELVLCCVVLCCVVLCCILMSV